MEKAKIYLDKYVTAATDLAESVKRNIVHGGQIDDQTVLLLNTFRIVANEIADLKDLLDTDPNEEDTDLN